MCRSGSGRILLVGGGARSGKSRFALDLAHRLGERRLFVATAEARDEEMTARIRRHQQERGGGFRLREEPRDLAAALGAVGDADVVLVDCLTLWLTNVLLTPGRDPERDTAELVDALGRVASAGGPRVILVTSEVGLGLVPESPLGRRFRDAAGTLHQAVAAIADRVYLAAMGTVLRLRPAPVAAVTAESEACP